MITTVTLNTSIDKAYTITKLKDHTVMRVLTCSNTAGGKGINVAKIISLCGEKVQATGFAGGYNGEYLRAMLKEQNITAPFVRIQGETRSCINILEEDGSSTEFLEPGVPVSEAELNEFHNQMLAYIRKSDAITISGSVPCGVPDTYYATLIKEIKQQGKPVILDTSGNLLKEGIKAFPTMIKPNADEIAQLLGRTVSDRPDLIAAGKELHQQGIAYVVISLGKEGALMICDEGIYHGRPPALETVNTVGSGDSMTGALAVALVRNLPPADALSYAVSVSAANTLTMKTGDFREEDRLRIQKQVCVDKLE